MIVIVIPFIAAQITKRALESDLRERASEAMSNLQIFFLSLAVFCIFASQGNLLLENITSIVSIFPPLIIFFIANTMIDLVVSRRIGFSYPEYASLTMTTLARNSPLALAIAINSFPGHELISIALVIGPLIELPVLYIISRFCLIVKKSDIFL